MDRDVRFPLVGVNEQSSLIGGYLSCNRADVGPAQLFHNLHHGLRLKKTLAIVTLKKQEHVQQNHPPGIISESVAFQVLAI
jgi:hypothetical protein